MTLFNKRSLHTLFGAILRLSNHPSCVRVRSTRKSLLVLSTICCILSFSAFGKPGETDIKPKRVTNPTKSTLRVAKLTSPKAVNKEESKGNAVEVVSHVVSSLSGVQSQLQGLNPRACNKNLKTAIDLSHSQVWWGSMPRRKTTPRRSPLSRQTAQRVTLALSQA